jgi:APA family basic amino acid/polyamine antiporter
MKPDPETSSVKRPGDKGEDLFVRNASGLVRDLRLRDAFIMNFGYAGASFSLSLAFVISQALWAYPQGNFIVAFVLAVVICAPGVILAYALMSAAIPRAGGDYVYISRTINPFLGFVSSFTLMVMLLFFVGWGAYWGGAQALSTVLLTVGNITGSSSVVDAGTWVAGQTGAFVVGVMVIVVFTLTSAAGTRFFGRMLAGMFALGLIGTIAGIAVMGLVSHGSFVTHFNGFMTHFSSGHNYYRGVLVQAHKSGTPLSGSSFGATIALLPILAFSTIFTMSSTYVGSEVRNPSKAQLWTMPGSLVILGIMNILVFVLLRRLVGGAFLIGINSLWYNGQLNGLPVPPYFNLFASVATSSALLAIVIGVGYLMMSMLFIPVQMAAATRLIFAYAFDRVLPSKLAEVDSRTNAPVYALVPMALISIAFLWILDYTTWFATLSGTAGLFPAMILACLAAAIMPWRSDAFRASRISQLRIGGVPLIVPAGVLGAGFLIVVLIAYLRNAKYLVNTHTSLTLIAATLATSVVIFVVSWAIRRRQGIDLGRVYRAIPPA